MSIEYDITEIVKDVTGSEDAFSSLLVIIAVSVIGIIVKIAYKGIINRLFSPKNLVTDTDEGEKIVPITKSNFERKNTSFEERLALRIKAMLQPELNKQHECIVRLEQKVDNYHDEATAQTEKVDELVKDFHRHVGIAEEKDAQINKKLDNLNGNSKP